MGRTGAQRQGGREAPRRTAAEDPQAVAPGERQRVEAADGGGRQPVEAGQDPPALVGREGLKEQAVQKPAVIHYFVNMQNKLDISLPTKISS